MEKFEKFVVEVQGTRLYRDPFGENMLSSAFEDRSKLLASIQKDLPKVDGPLWWLSKDMNGQQILHATLTDPGNPCSHSASPPLGQCCLAIQVAIRCTSTMDVPVHMSLYLGQRWPCASTVVVVVVSADVSLTYQKQTACVTGPVNDMYFTGSLHCTRYMYAPSSRPPTVSH
jgi:hypothetical protein